MQDQAKAGYFDVVANTSLVPAITLSPSTTVNLTDEDKEAAKKWAVEQCGGAQDDKCVKERTATAESTTLQKKMAEQSSTANIVKGRRLTMTVVDDSGREQTVQVPDGQRLKIGEAPQFKMPTASGTVLQVWKVAMIILGALLYAFSVVITYRTFVLVGQEYLGYGLTALAAFFPPSGLIITPLGFLIMNYFGKTNISAAP
jgi:hypothetical protein